ncbi:MAG: phosphoribosylanthranilate isomerase [Tannerellaceae bacterium]|jgi:phosphoribosylanthranilate isomerase|nr:phosphoribosylanthranilate isomerase [Tannerellaceae bacterium]
MIIKVCGMCHRENILQVARLGADWIGFIFWAGSERWVDADRFESMMGAYHRSAPFKKAGVFVNAFIEDIMGTATRCRLDYLQLHGDESPVICHTLQKRGFRLIKAFHIEAKEDLERTAEYEGRADYFLFDTRCSGYGGSGRSFDWQVLRAYTGKTPFLISGGINPGSLEAIRGFSHPCFAGIDLNSGFETVPGLKDISRLTPFIRSLKTNNL